MATKRIKDITSTAASVASDAYLAIDGTANGTEKITRDNFRQDTADAFVAAPGTYNLAPLSGGAVPIDKGGTAATTAAGARTSLDVPSNSEAVLAANNLSDVTAATARANLSVNSVDEDAEATGTKLVGPALYFRGAGPNDHLEVAYDAKLSFTDGTDDLPFSISAFINMDDATGFPVATKHSAAREWVFRTDGADKLILNLSDGTNIPEIATDTALTAYEGQWIHVCVTRPSVGPNGDQAFDSSEDGTIFYINGQAVAATASNNDNYTGMSDGGDPVYIGRHTSTRAKGHIRNVQIFNRELTATEVAQLARGADLGFADEWGGALGGVYTQDSTPSGEWTGTNLVDSDEAGPISGRSNILKLTCNAGSSTHYIQDAKISSGKRYRVEGFYYIPSGQSNVDGFRIGTNTSSDLGVSVSVATLDAWTKVSCEFISNSANIRITLSDGGAQTFDDTGGDDIAYFDGLTITEIGTLADFRAENFIADKLIDLSSNNFVGTNNGATLVGGRKALQLDTDGAAAGNKVLSVFNGSSHLASITDKGDLDANSIGSGAATELTISSGAVTVTKSHHTIDTESDAASDDLDTINGGRAGQLLILRAANGARDVVLKDGTGNLKLSGDITLDNTEDTATLVSDGTSWYLLATSNNGA